MQKSRHIILFNLILFLFLSSNTQGQNFDKKDWKLKTSKGKLKVYTRDNAHSDIKEIRIKSTVDAPIQKVADVLHDVSGYEDWVFKTMAAKKLKTNAPNDFYYYTKSDFPFPIADRDLVIRIRLWKEKKTGIIFSHSQSVPNIVSNRERNC